MKKVEKSMQNENKMYRVDIPWKENEPSLPDNYGMALHRLEKTEKRLKRSPYVAAAYSQCIEQYIERGYVRKIAVHEQSRSKWYLPHFPLSGLTKIQQKQGSYSMHRRSVEVCP